LNIGVADGGGGFLNMSNKDEKRTCHLATGIDGSGLLEISNANGAQTCYLGTNDYGSGFLTISNMYENIIAGFGASPEDGKDGTAVLWDRYGDTGWSASGKQ